MALLLKLLSLSSFLLMLIRISLNTLNFVSSAACIASGDIVEACRGSSILKQSVSDEINAFGALCEGVNSFILLVCVFCWEHFHPLKFLQAIFLVGHFWIWFGLAAMESAAALYLNVAFHGQSKYLLGWSTVLEFNFGVLFACAINFVARQTVKHWIERKLRAEEKEWKTFIFVLYDSMLLSYVFRHLGLFLYDTALVAMSFNLSNNAQTTTKDWTSFLLVMSVALRGSFAHFFFAKFFQGRILPKVC